MSAEPEEGPTAMDTDQDPPVTGGEEKENELKDSDKMDEGNDVQAIAKETAPGEGGEGEAKNADIAESDDIPDYKTQKEEIQPLLSQRLKKGDEWYLVDQRWLKQWKKYTGFDSWDQYHAGNEAANPGPVDNSNLFKSEGDHTLKDHLMEELDYALLPKPAWEKLVRWYGFSVGSHPICRRVVEYGTYVKHLKVEVYLFDLKTCIHPHVNDIKHMTFSRADTIKIVEDKLREVFEVPSETETRLWQRYMTNSYELLSNVEQTLSDAGIYGGQMLMLEKKNPEGQWSRTSGTTSTHYNTRSSQMTSSSSYGSSYTSSYFDRGREPSTPGLCGLSNLGNTCFMNSALQCLSNTQPLIEYFVGNEKKAEKPYKKHINKDNPLGMGGALAETYGNLLEEIWSGQNSYLAPRQFKLMIGKHAPQFSGFQQHDSHELLAFLLDGLHEDLNLVKKKPYVDMDIKTTNRNDKEIAEETWHKYLLRNQSVIVRLFQGQLKSTLNCPKCKKTSRIFDPFMYLSLPLPIMKTRDIVVYLVRADPTICTMKYRISVPKNGIISDLKESMKTLANTDPAKLVVIDVYHSRFHRVYYDKDPLSHIMDRDDIYLYELQTPLGDPEWVPVPVYMRELKSHKSYTYYGQQHVSTYGQVFGLPIVVTVPRKGCTYRTLYETIMGQIKRYVTIPKEETNGESKEKESDKEEGKQEEGQQKDEGNILKSEDLSNEGDTEEMDVQPTVEPEPGNSMNDDGDQSQTENKQTENKSNKNEEPMDTEGNDEEKHKEEEEENKNNDLFKLVVVNSYGSQEVQKLKDGDQLLKLTSQTYIGCDWVQEVKDDCYDLKIAESYEQHESCTLPKEEKKAITVYDCMDLFVQKEILGEDDAWYCPSCKDFVQASKKFDLWKMPEILVIHLKRFSYNRWYRNKIEARVEFPLEGLDLTNYVVTTDEGEPPPHYDLFAVSNHYGGLGGGHYTAFVKNKDTGKWYSFDDSHVSEVATDSKQICSTASYVLFYQRKTEGKRGIPDILNRSLSVSFDEEVKEGHHKFRNQSIDVDTNRIEEEREEDQVNEDGEGNIGNDSTFEDDRPEMRDIEKITEDCK